MANKSPDSCSDNDEGPFSILGGDRKTFGLPSNASVHDDSTPNLKAMDKMMVERYGKPTDSQSGMTEGCTPGTNPRNKDGFSG